VTAQPDSARAPRSPDLGAPVTVLLVRHGRTPLTEQRRFSGRGGPDPELSDGGRADARHVAAALAPVPADPGRRGTDVPGTASPRHPRDLPDLPPIEAVRCSPLARTRATGAAVATACGLSATVDEGWAEAGFGLWEGLGYAEVAEGWPDLLRSWQGSSTVAPPGGESLVEVMARVEGALARLRQQHPGGTVAVATHVTPIRAVLRYALEAGVPTMWRVRLAPASITVVRFWSDGGAEVRAVNVTAHLGHDAVNT